MMVAMLLSVGLLAQNNFYFTYGTGFSSTGSSLSFGYSVVCSDLLTSVGGGGRVYGRVLLQGSPGTFYVGSFQHRFSASSSSVTTYMPGTYTENPYNPYPPTSAPVTTGSNIVTLPVNSTCIPVGTYTVRIELYTDQAPPPELPHNATPTFTVGGSTYVPLPLWHAHPGGLLLDALITGYIGGGNIGSFTVSSGGGSISGSSSVTPGNCTTHPTINTTTTGGTSPYTLYYWNTALSAYTAASISSASASISIPNATQGTYNFEVLDANGCRWNGSATTVKPGMTVNVSPASQSICRGTCVFLSATSGSGGTGFSYTWQQSNPSTAPNTVSTAPSFCTAPPYVSPSITTANTYQVTMSNAYCSGSASTVQTVKRSCIDIAGNGCCGAVDGRSALREDVAPFDMPLKIFPNPATGHVLNVTFAEVESPDVFMEVYDASGKLLKKHLIPQGVTTVEMDISDFSQGIYMVRLALPGGVLHSQKFIRQ